MLKFHQSEYAHLKDNMDIWPEGIKCESPIATLLHDMIGDDPTEVSLPGEFSPLRIRQHE